MVFQRRRQVVLVRKGGRRVVVEAGRLLNRLRTPVGGLLPVLVVMGAATSDLPARPHSLAREIEDLLRGEPLRFPEILIGGVSG